MSNESFEEFYKKQVSCEQYALSYDSRDMEIIRNHYERSKANMKETWVHQQKKIQELEKTIEIRENRIKDSRKLIIVQREKIQELENENKKLKNQNDEVYTCLVDENETFRKLVKVKEENEELEKLLGEAVKIMSDEYSYSEAEVLGDEFLMKPEIQKYLPEGEE